jgi:hypothetical protein
MYHWNAGLLQRDYTAQYPRRLSSSDKRFCLYLNSVCMQHSSAFIRSEILAAVKTWMLFFWVVTLYRLVSRYRRFGRIYCLHLQPLKWRQHVPVTLSVTTCNSTRRCNPQEQHRQPRCCLLCNLCNTRPKISQTSQCFLVYPLFVVNDKVGEQFYFNANFFPYSN